LVGTTLTARSVEDESRNFFLVFGL